MDLKATRFEVSDGIATITLNRPDVLNSINFEMWHGLLDAFRAVTDEMVDSLALAGTPDAVRHQSQRFEGLADSIILSSPYFGVGREETRANHAAMLEAFGS